MNAGELTVGITLALTLSAHVMFTWMQGMGMGNGQ